MSPKITPPRPPSVSSFSNVYVKQIAIDCCTQCTQYSTQFLSYRPYTALIIPTQGIIHNTKRRYNGPDRVDK